MCGIAGVALRAGAHVDREAVGRMTAALVHRGPDAGGAFFGDGIGLGHRRLAIVDLTPAGAQPMCGPRGVLTFNGEIYNFREVREELASVGRTVVSSGDTEVLLAALETWGEGALRRLEGMFAFGYYRPDTRTLLLARDRFGEKPLYYAPFGPSGEDGIAFASELGALVRYPRVHAGRAIDPVAVAQYFLHEFVPAPRSIFVNVKKLEAGCALTWTDGGKLTLKRYYLPPCGARHAKIDEREATVELRRLGDAATRARLVADVPVGVFLSGGLDSSFLAASAARVHPRVRTFSVAFDDASFDESVHARAVANHLGTEHFEHRLREQDLLAVVPQTLDVLDEPFADTSLIPTTLLAREARKDVTVALGGEGGDELLAGYPTFVVGGMLERIPAPPSSVARFLAHVAELVPPRDGNFSSSFVARQLAQGLGFRGARRHAAWLAPLVPAGLAALAGPRLELAAVDHSFDVVDACGAGATTVFDAATDFYLRVYLGEGVLTKVDRATMRASLEGRAPLLDRRLAEFCLGLPQKLRVRGTTTKWLMRRALDGAVPDSIVSRKKKGFGAPVGTWLRGPLRAVAEDTLAPPRVAAGGWLDPTAVSRMLAAHVAGADHRKALYAILVFEHWRQRVMG